MYLYEIELDRDIEVSEYVHEEDAYGGAPASTADKSEQRFSKYNVEGVTRYLNHFESPGSLSLLANPKKFRIVNKKAI